MSERPVCYDRTAENLREGRAQLEALSDALQLFRSYLKAGMPLDDKAKHLLADFDILLIDGTAEFLLCLDAAIEKRETDE